jgi:hypothetical protein
MLEHILFNDDRTAASLDLSPAAKVSLAHALETVFAGVEVVPYEALAQHLPAAVKREIEERRRHQVGKKTPAPAPQKVVSQCKYCLAPMDGQHEFCSMKCQQAWTREYAAIQRLNGRGKPPTLAEINQRFERRLRQQRVLRYPLRYPNWEHRTIDGRFLP